MKNACLLPKCLYSSDCMKISAPNPVNTSQRSVVPSHTTFLVPEAVTMISISSSASCMILASDHASLNFAMNALASSTMLFATVPSAIGS